MTERLTSEGSAGMYFGTRIVHELNLAFLVSSHSRHGRAFRKPESKCNVWPYLQRGAADVGKAPHYATYARGGLHGLYGRVSQFAAKTEVNKYCWTIRLKPRRLYVQTDHCNFRGFFSQCSRRSCSVLDPPAGFLDIDWRISSGAAGKWWKDYPCSTRLVFTNILLVRVSRHFVMQYASLELQYRTSSSAWLAGGTFLLPFTAEAQPLFACM